MACKQTFSVKTTTYCARIDKYQGVQTIYKKVYLYKNKNRISADSTKMDKLDFVLLEYKDDTSNEYISLCVTCDYIFDSSKSFAIPINECLQQHIY